MSVLQYFAKKLVGSLPNLEGTLSNVIPSAAIKLANSEVKKVMGQGHTSSRVSCKETRKGKKSINMLHIHEIFFGKCPTVSLEYFFMATVY